MRVTQVLPSLDPSLGGTVESVVQMSRALAPLGVRTEIVTLDAPDHPWPSPEGATAIGLGPGHGSYGYSPAFVPWLRENAGRADIVVVNGLWQYHAFGAWRALRRRGVPYVLYPHGMLDPWFRRRYPLKHLKKQLYWPWADARLVRDARAVLFTTETERRLASRSLVPYRPRLELVAPFGTRPPPPASDRQVEAFRAVAPYLGDRAFLLFLGRLHEKKGCDLLIQAFADLGEPFPPWDLVFVGGGDERTAAGLKAMAEATPVAARIHFTGPLQGDAKWGALRLATAFILPSHQENFGISVAEALACGTPVIVSDRVNIAEDIAAAGAGLVVTDTRHGVETGLRRLARLAPGELADLSRRGRALFNDRYDLDRAAVALLRTFELCRA